MDRVEYDREIGSLAQTIEDEKAYLAKYEARLTAAISPAEVEKLCGRISRSLEDLKHLEGKLANLKANPPQVESRRYTPDWQIEQNNMQAQTVRQGVAEAANYWPE